MANNEQHFCDGGKGGGKASPRNYLSFENKMFASKELFFVLFNSSVDDIYIDMYHFLYSLFLIFYPKLSSYFLHSLLICTLIKLDGFFRENFAKLKGHMAVIH